MDYKRFRRTNGIITLVGSILSLALSVILMFFPNVYDMLGLFPAMLGFIIAQFREFGLTLKSDYDQNEHLKSDLDPTDIPKQRLLISAGCTLGAVVLCIIKAVAY